MIIPLKFDLKVFLAAHEIFLQVFSSLVTAKYFILLDKVAILVTKPVRK